MKRIGKHFLAMGIVCIMASLSLFVYNRVMDGYAGEFSHRVTEDIKEYISHQKEDREDMPTSDESSELPISEIQLEGYDYMGYLTIPKLSLELPVASVWNYDKLSVSPCRYSGSVVTRDLVIAGHNYESHFAGLGELLTGDEVIYTDINGNRFYYEVVLTDTLSPFEIDKMTDSGYDLSLFTCTLTATARVTVRCSRK